MVLVDTSVWIDHFRKSNQRLIRILENQLVVVHPFIIGELALGSIKNRSDVLNMLGSLPSTPVVREYDILQMIEDRRLFASGIGYTDAHILASALIASDIRIWTHDKRLHTISENLGVAVTS